MWKIYYRTPWLILRGRGPRGTKFIVAKLERQGSYVATVARLLRHRSARGRIWPLSGVMDKKLRERIWPLPGVKG